jgi:hypothetical protein
LHKPGLERKSELAEIHRMIWIGWCMERKLLSLQLNGIVDTPLLFHTGGFLIFIIWFDS